MDIVIFPDERLRKKAKRVILNEIKSPKIKKLINEMGRLMLEQDGIGLAAPQVGMSKRLIIVATQTGVAVFINPKILSRSWKKETAEEGCLSVPGRSIRVRRSTKITVEFYDMNAEKQELNATGLFARVLQHEIDHLDGILIIDK
ncbi:MAG: peptide deformylase [Candidatus Falkowbacteria bacterium]